MLLSGGSNGPDAVLDDTARAIRPVAQDYVHAHRAAQQAGSARAAPEPAWPSEDAMSDESSVVDAVRKALHSEPRVHPTEGQIHLAFVDGDLAMESEVDHIAGNKLAL